MKTKEEILEEILALLHRAVRNAGGSLLISDPFRQAAGDWIAARMPKLEDPELGWEGTAGEELRQRLGRSGPLLLGYALLWGLKSLDARAVAVLMAALDSRTFLCDP